MAKHLVVRSINDYGEMRCIDLFQRPDGSFGFEEYRRDPEDGRGWYPVGGYGGAPFATAEAALERAKGKVAWLADAVLTS